MDIKIVNITLLRVNGELENFSGEIYPIYTYQKILHHFKLRQKLLTYVLDRIPNHYAALSNEKILSVSPTPITSSLSLSTQEKLELKTLVQLGVVYLILSEINKNSSLRQTEAV